MKLLDQFTAVMRRNHYSLRTEKTYWHWIVAFLRHHCGPKGRVAMTAAPWSAAHAAPGSDDVNFVNILINRTDGFPLDELGEGALPLRGSRSKT